MAFRLLPEGNEEAIATIYRFHYYDTFFRPPGSIVKINGKLEHEGGKTSLITVGYPQVSVISISDPLTGPQLEKTLEARLLSFHRFPFIAF